MIIIIKKERGITKEAVNSFIQVLWSEEEVK